MIERLVLIGLSGTGKSTLAKRTADLLGWTCLDTDAQIEREAGMTIPEIFDRHGEPQFRDHERATMEQALARSEVVVATGGGAPLSPGIWANHLLGRDTTCVVWLDAPPDELLQRLIDQETVAGASVQRPLLQGADPLERFRQMQQVRSPVYAQADVSLTVDAPAEALAKELADLVHIGRNQQQTVEFQADDGSSSRITIGNGARHQIGSVVEATWPSARKIWAGVDEHVMATIGQDIRASTTRPVSLQAVPSGENSKSLDQLQHLYDWMLGGRVTRGDVAVAVGGGVVGDLMGFAAATTLRGIGLVQVPTTLLAMVDSSVGGKTGINHAAGKNLIGAFYQPARVLVDPEALATLPDREFHSGWAEVIKHAVIEPSVPNEAGFDLLTILERNAPALLARSPVLLPWVIRRNIQIKAAVVTQDAREAGLRAILNFGHTIGHAIEASGYAMLHGEAVAVGMCGALKIGHEMALIDDAFVDRVRSVIAAYRLPLSAPVHPSEVLERIGSDKKKANGEQQWILPSSSGGVEVRTAVPQAVIDRAVTGVCGR